MLERTGENLIRELAEATGLPREMIQTELRRILTEAGIAPENVTLETLRPALAKYMREVILAAKFDLEDGAWISEELL